MMRSKLILASLVTLGILASFVFFVLYLVAFMVHLINFPVLIALTIITNVVLWLVNPTITDWLQSVFYKVRRVPFEEFQSQHKEVAVFLQQVCETYRIKVPRLRIIDDANPTAYCYGSYPDNARVVVSEGIFKYLNIEEQKAVIGHELGHIVNRDFIIMTVAVTLLQILYEIYFVFTRRPRRRSGKGDITPLIGLISFIFYLIGSYLVLYLSRTREYLADRFSATVTNNPDALSMALVKIAYGIAVEVDNDSTKRLLNSTRAMGIYDVKAANSLGTAFGVAAKEKGELAAKDIIDVFLFDLISPWAVISEINSTHPLTGKRIRALSEYSIELGKISKFDFEAVIQEAKTVDRSKLYRGFAVGIVVYILPIIAILAGFCILIVQISAFPIAIMVVGFGFLIQGLYKYRRIGASPEKVTVLELMKDPYANPLRGRYVELEGSIIGKADAGSYLGEDLKMRDRSDCLITLNYESIVPVLGDFYFGLVKATKIIGQHVVASGWFRRSTYQVVDLDSLRVNDQKIRSYTRFWGIILGLFIVLIGVGFLGYTSITGYPTAGFGPAAGFENSVPVSGYQTGSSHHTQVPAVITSVVATTPHPINYCILSIMSNPPGAIIKVDGDKLWKTTPVQAGFPQPGQHTIVISHPGYEDYVITVNLVVGQTTNVSADLVPL
jgi:Zn-dependent protease with chaperone function